MSGDLEMGYRYRPQQRKLALNNEQVEERSNICSTRGVTSLKQRASSSAPRGIRDPIVAASVAQFHEHAPVGVRIAPKRIQGPHNPNWNRTRETQSKQQERACDRSLHRCDR